MGDWHHVDGKLDDRGQNSTGFGTAVRAVLGLCSLGRLDRPRDTCQNDFGDIPRHVLLLELYL